MPHQDIPRRTTLSEAVINRQNRSTGVTEDEFHAIVFKTFGNYFRARDEDHVPKLVSVEM